MSPKSDIPRRGPSASNIARNDEIIRRRERGHTYGQIAFALRLSRNAVAGALRRAGLCEDGPPRPPSRPQEFVDAVAALRAEGLTHSQIARRLNVTKGVVSSILYRRVVCA